MSKSGVQWSESCDSYSGGGAPQWAVRDRARFDASFGGRCGQAVGTQTSARSDPAFDVHKTQWSEEPDMLVLSRKVGEAIHIGDQITVIVSRIDGNRVRLALNAPRDVHIVPSELEPLSE